MKIKKFLMVFLIIFITRISSAEELSESNKVKLDIKVNSKNKFVSLNYEIGKCKGILEAMPINVRKKGNVKKDILEEYYKDGSVKAELKYEKGKLNGLSNYYYEDYYKNKTENEKQKIRWGIRSFVNGKLDGESRDYFAKDKPAVICKFSDNKLEGKIKFFSYDGNLNGEAHFQNNDLEGIVRIYSDDGEVSYSANYRAGKMLREYTDGVLTYSAHYKDDLYNGQIIRIIEDKYYGTLRENVVFMDGEKDGLTEVFYKDKKIKTEATYEKDIIKNIKEFDRMGNLIFDHDYNCEEIKDVDNLVLNMPATAKMFIDKVEVSKDGVTIYKKENFEENFNLSRVYLSKYFDDNKMFIPRKSDLKKYRVRRLKEKDDYKDYAFIAAYKEVDDKSEEVPYKILYLKDIKEKNANMILVDSISKKDKNFIYNFSIYKNFESFKKCKVSDEEADESIEAEE